MEDLSIVEVAGRQVIGIKKEGTLQTDTRTPFESL